MDLETVAGKIAIGSFSYDADVAAVSDIAALMRSLQVDDGTTSQAGDSYTKQL